MIEEKWAVIARAREVQAAWQEAADGPSGDAEHAAACDMHDVISDLIDALEGS